MEQKYFVDMV
jgi:T-complex protein 1 subunit epsilon